MLTKRTAILFLMSVYYTSYVWFAACDGSNTLKRYSNPLKEQCLKGSKRRSPSISLCNLFLTEVGENVFSRCKKLLNVLLEQNQISNVSSSAFNGTNIKLLNLDRNRLICIPNVAMLAHSLSAFYIKNNLLNMCQKGNIYNIQFAKLGFLHLNDNALSHLSEMTILFASPYLKFLVLEGNQLTQLDDLQSLYPHLVQLRLWDNPITCYCGAWWLKYSQLTRLRCMSCYNGGPLSGREWDPVRHTQLQERCATTGMSSICSLYTTLIESYSSG